jgi:hypothetical protein
LDCVKRNGTAAEIDSQVWNSVVRCGDIDVVLYGMVIVLYGVVWYGMLWCFMVLYSMM